jgi:hypothetical protein
MMRRFSDDHNRVTPFDPRARVPHGTSLLPADLSSDQLDAAPVLGSIDSRLIEELSEDEDDGFAAALES